MDDKIPLVLNRVADTVQRVTEAVGQRFILQL
jgi:hypothetical protein